MGSCQRNEPQPGSWPKNLLQPDSCQKNEPQPGLWPTQQPEIDIWVDGGGKIKACLRKSSIESADTATSPPNVLFERLLSLLHTHIYRVQADDLGLLPACKAAGMLAVHARGCNFGIHRPLVTSALDAAVSIPIQSLGERGRHLRNAIHTRPPTSTRKADNLGLLVASQSHLLISSRQAHVEKPAAG